MSGQGGGGGDVGHVHVRGESTYMDVESLGFLDMGRVIRPWPRLRGGTLYVATGETLDVAVVSRCGNLTGLGHGEKCGSGASFDMTAVRIPLTWRRQRWTWRVRRQLAHYWLTLQCRGSVELR